MENKKSFSIPDTIMEPDPSSCYCYSVKLEEKKTESGLILNVPVETEYRNKEKALKEVRRRILVKTGYLFRSGLSQPALKIFGKTVARLRPRPGDEIVRMDITEMAQHVPTMCDPNTIVKFELYHQMEIRGIIYNSAIARPWWEKMAIRRILSLQDPCTRILC